MFSKYDSTHRTEIFKLPSNPQLFVHLCGVDSRIDLNSNLIVLIHGFPELGFSWRYQWSCLSKLGYSICSPDMRGYGNSWIPSNIDDYSFKEVTKDLIYLIKELKREKAIFIGHDFGGSVVWAMGFHHEEVCLSIIGVNTPLFIPPPIPEMIKAGGPVHYMKTLDSKLCGHFDYQAYFLDFGEEELNENPERTMRAYFRSQISNDPTNNKENMRLGMRTNRCREKRKDDPTKLRGVMSSCAEIIPRDPLWSVEEIQIYSENFKKTGFPLKWYRAMDMNWQWDSNTNKQTINIPCLMITAEYDAVLTPEISKGMETRIPNLERQNLECGHWTMIERKDEFNEILIEYLTRKFPNKQNDHTRGKL